MVCGTMPYDDSNVRQMVKEQLAHKIRFPPQAAYNLSLQCKDLISKLIEPDPKKRLNIQGIQQHPWIANRLRYGSYSKSSGVDLSQNMNIMDSGKKTDNPTDQAAETSQEADNEQQQSSSTRGRKSSGKTKNYTGHKHHSQRDRSSSQEVVRNKNETNGQFWC
jgi:serine/threonine protein kinase